MTTQIIIMAVLILMSAYFSATETAFSSLNRTRVKTLAEKGNRRAELVLKLVDQYDRLISTILVGNNIVNIALASMGTVVFMELCGPAKGATISTVVVTVAVLIFGEVSPKSIAKDSPERFAMFSAPMIRVLIYLLLPVNLLFSGWKKLLSKILKMEAREKMSSEELLMLVEEVQQEGSIDVKEGELLKNAIEFDDRRAEDILTHRTELEGVSVDADTQEAAKLFSETKFSRLLVFEETMDNIVGVIHHKDFYVGGGLTKKTVRQLMSKPLFVLKSEKVDDLLRKLQKQKSHIAVVLDEYGGTLGIVTMEDILEELVGEIWDEHDEVVEMFQKLQKDTYLVDCSVDLDEFCEFFRLEPGEESVSLGGWVMEMLGKIPEVGDVCSCGEYEIQVVEVDNHRVEKIKVRRVASEETAESAK